MKKRQAMKCWEKYMDGHNYKTSTVDQMYKRVRRFFRKRTKTPAEILLEEIFQGPPQGG